ncbi:hypothetical protein AB7101_15600, partial [Providencia rettgeri]
VLISYSKLKALRNPQPSWGFSMHKKANEFPHWLQFALVINSILEILFIYAIKENYFFSFAFAFGKSVMLPS